MNIRTLLMTAALVPALAFAQENDTITNTAVTKNSHDTTFVFNKQKYEISQNGERTNVKVYKKNGTELKKTLETQYLDGQQVEQVYITSPFIPVKSYKKNNREYSHYPLLYMGSNLLSNSALNPSSKDKYVCGNKSAEWGITGITFAMPLNGTLAITTAMTVSFVKHQFNKDYVLGTTDGITSLKPFSCGENDEHAKESYLYYGSVRIPVMLEWSKQIGSQDAYVAIGPSLEFRNEVKSRYKVGKKKHTYTKDVNMNNIGLNLEARIGYGFLMLYARTALTPLLRTKYAPEWYPFTAGIGFRF